MRKFKIWPRSAMERDKLTHINIGMNQNEHILHYKDLQPGDILMSEFEHPDAKEYFEALLIALQYRNHKTEPEKKKFMSGVLVILRGLIITFDRDIYTHAAFWNGEAVVEAGMSGVNANPISHYMDTVTDVYRFTNSGEGLGSEAYPTDPVLQKANWLVDQDLDYSFETAYLYMFLCVTRWNRAQWIEDVQKFLEIHVKAVDPKYIELFFKVYHHKIVQFFEWMADEIIRLIIAFRDDKGLVCSETVAYIFNKAEPVGKYHLEKPLDSSDGQLHKSKQEPTILDCANIKTERLLNDLTESFKQAEFPKTSGKNAENWSQAIDIEYTPHDIARSKNTHLAGRLVLIG